MWFDYLLGKIILMFCVKYFMRSLNLSIQINFTEPTEITKKNISCPLDLFAKFETAVFLDFSVSHILNDVSPIDEFNVLLKCVNTFLSCRLPNNLR